VAGTLGGAVALIVVLFALFCCCRMWARAGKRRSAHQHNYRHTHDHTHEDIEDQDQGWTEYQLPLNADMSASLIARTVEPSF
jgi:ABC-type nickel/cobalt efflux system permease component RcnA